MGFATSPFTLEPVRSNEFKEAQISKEIHSLTSHIETLTEEIRLIKQGKIDKEERERESGRLAREGSLAAKKMALVKEQELLEVGAVKTSDCYKTKGLPLRFERPDTWKYQIKKQHASYTTTTNSYGSAQPTIHDMPNKFMAQSSKFSVYLDQAGPYRNFSLNI